MLTDANISCMYEAEADTIGLNFFNSWGMSREE